MRDISGHAWPAAHKCPLCPGPTWWQWGWPLHSKMTAPILTHYLCNTHNGLRSHLCSLSLPSWSNRKTVANFWLHKKLENLFLRVASLEQKGHQPNRFLPSLYHWNQLSGVIFNCHTNFDFCWINHLKTIPGTWVLPYTWSVLLCSYEISLQFV